MMASVSLQTKQKASMRSSLRFITHIRPRHGLRFGWRLHGTRVSAGGADLCAPPRNMGNLTVTFYTAGAATPTRSAGSAAGGGDGSGTRAAARAARPGTANRTSRRMALANCEASEPVV